MYRFMIRGTRGTLPACGPDFVRYGGDTTCFSVQTPDGMILIDAGTGIRHVMRELAAAASPRPSVAILLTHLHMDHLIGLPSFDPLFNPEARLRFMADPQRDEDWRAALNAFMRQPYWPVGLSDVGASLTFEDLPAERSTLELMGVEIRWLRVPHPQQCVAFRVTTPTASIVVATDIELVHGAMPTSVVDFCASADALIFDAQYTPEEYAIHRGWGHSTWEAGAELAEAAQVGHLILTHHAPLRTDTGIDAIVAACRERFAATSGATTNMMVNANGPA